LSVVNAARVTMGVVRGALVDRDEGLIRFLAREKHVTPFRHATVTFRCEAPIAIARQLGKHQVGFSWNEMSRRYKDGDVSCFVPEQFFLRPEDLHSGSGEAIEPGSSSHEKLQNLFEAAYDGSVAAYRGLVDAGIAPEQARFLLPQGMITEWVWTGSLYGWAELYRQRSSDHAQY
ncbi:FAD-dependent thymidylate synthase, partial [Herbiconiux daphne]